MTIVQWDEEISDEETYPGYPPHHDVERIIRDDPNVRRCLDYMTQDLEEEVVSLDDFLKEDVNDEEQTAPLVDDPTVPSMDYSNVHAAVLTPIDFSSGEMVELGGKRKRWLKRILPYAPIHYEGRILQFTKEMAKKAADNFKKQPVEQVVFNFVDENNNHNDDPLRVAGEVVDIQAKSDGLYAAIETNAAGTDYLTETNPNVGVSVRFIPNFLRRWDKKFFGPVIQHVAAVCDPHITGLGPWKPLETSNSRLNKALGEDYLVVDLSGASYEKSEKKGESVSDQEIKNDETREEVQEEVKEEKKVELSSETPDEEKFDLAATIAASNEAKRQVEELEQRLRASEEKLELSRDRELRASVHSMLRDRFGSQGIPEWAIEDAQEILLFANVKADQEVIELSASGTASVKEESIGDKVLKLLEGITKDRVDLSGERGTSRPAEELEKAKKEHEEKMAEYALLAGVAE